MTHTHIHTLVTNIFRVFIPDFHSGEDSEGSIG